MTGRAWRPLAVLTLLVTAAVGVPGTTAVFHVTAPVGANTIGARTTFGLTQTAGCFSNDGTDGAGGTCATATPTRKAQVMAVSPDGKNVYVGSVTDGTISQFSRDATTGALTPLSPACLSKTAVTGCTTGTGLDQIYDLLVSPDGKNVYAAAYWSSDIAEFSRDTTTGALTQLAAPNACLVDSGVTAPAGCTVGKALYGVDGISTSPDGNFLYATSADGNSLAGFSRNATTGVLTQLTGTGSCFVDGSASGGCSGATGLPYPYYNRVSPDGKNVYVASHGTKATVNGIAAFSRDTTTGLLSQLPAPNACYSYTNTSCTKMNGLTSVYDLRVSPDGGTVAATSDWLQSNNNDFEIASLTRNATTGALTLANCFYSYSSNFLDGCSAPAGYSIGAIGMDGPTALAFSPDGNYLLVAGNYTTTSSVYTGGVAMFTHDNSTGVIAQMAGTNACVNTTTAASSTSGCSLGRAVKFALGVAVSPDGRDVYVSGGDSSSGYIAVLNRTH